MTAWFYGSFGFALLSILQHRERARGSRAIWIFSLKLSWALTLLAAVDFLFNAFFWEPSGRNDLRIISLFLWGLLVDEAMGQGRENRKVETGTTFLVSSFYLALMGFSFWMIEREKMLPLAERLLWGLGLPLMSGLFEWLLQGLRQRLRLAQIPGNLEGTALVFWVAVILSLAFLGFENWGRNL